VEVTVSARVPVIVAGVLAVSGLAVATIPARVAMRAELRKRWRTWALAAPVYLGALWLGSAGAFALAAGLGVIAVAEYARMAAVATVREGATAGAAVREGATAGTAGAASPGTTLPGEAAPGAAPCEAAPGTTLSGGTSPRAASPGKALPGRAATSTTPPGAASPRAASPGKDVPGSPASSPSAPGDLLVLAAASVLLPALAWLAPGVLDLRGAALLLVVAALPALLGGDAERGFTRTARNVFGLVWIPVALTGLVLLGTDTAMAVGLAVALGDVGAWCGGTAFGRRGPLARPLSPLSPNKTWAGVAGCAVATALALAVVGAFSPVLWGAVLLGCLLGDLLESMVKRESGVKDAGSWLPGFGGLLDRIDSLLLALLLAMVVTL
jgi:phosphatidate cytidylyltransferase